MSNAYKVYFVNFDTLVPENFQTFEDALSYGKAQCFEFRIDYAKTPVAFWSPISGLRRFK
jgi:hypothetical protein